MRSRSKAERCERQMYVSVMCPRTQRAQALATYACARDGREESRRGVACSWRVRRGLSDGSFRQSFCSIVWNAGILFLSRLRSSGGLPFPLPAAVRPQMLREPFVAGRKRSVLDRTLALGTFRTVWNLGWKKEILVANVRRGARVSQADQVWGIAKLID